MVVGAGGAGGGVAVVGVGSVVVVLGGGSPVVVVGSCVVSVVTCVTCVATGAGGAGFAGAGLSATGTAGTVVAARVFATTGAALAVRDIRCRPGWRFVTTASRANAGLAGWERSPTITGSLM